MNRRTMVPLVCLWILAFPPHCRSSAFRSGIEHFNRQEYALALGEFREAVELVPDSAVIYLWLGKTYASMDSSSRARETFDRARELCGPDSDRLENDLKNTLDHFWAVHHNNGLCYAKSAMDAQLRKDDARAWREFHSSLAAFENARIFRADREETPRNMGAVYFHLGEYEKGLECLRESSRLAPPGDRRAEALLFHQYRYLGDQLVSAAETPGPHVAISLAKAVEYLLEAERLEPDNTDLLYSIGLVYLRLADADVEGGDPNRTKAAEYFDKTIRVSPDHADALYQLGAIYLQLDECEKGLACSGRLLALDPGNEMFAELHRELQKCE